MQDICPLPIYWIEVVKRLSDAAAKSGRPVPAPPMPIVLSGWVFSNDVDKLARWQQTLEWAERWGFREIIDELGPDRMYRVEHPTTYDIGPFGGPLYQPWNFDPKPAVSDEEAERAVRLLQSGWGKIAGPELGSVTRPLRLTGAKKRRLVVYADRSTKPRWGTWMKLSEGPERREFTRLRAAINAAIHPLAVDHVVFVRDSQERDG